MFESQPPDSAPAAGRAGGADDRARAPARVLLAEDNRDLRMILSRQLSLLGLEVETASNGRDAVDQALDAHRSGEPFDLILMDLEMPVLDGYQATGQLREAGLSGPILALTAHSGEDTRRDVLRVGYNDALCKPFTLVQLRDLVRKFVPLPGGDDEPPAALR